jgi:hypothetical protein
LAQPLHAAALFTEELFPTGDKGGNSIKIRREGTSGGGQELHSVWDGLLGKNANFNNVLGNASALIASHSAEFNSPFVALPNDVWSTESQAVAIQAAYGPILAEIQEAEENGGPLAVIEVPENYFIESGDVARRQAVVAGVRLAGVLAATVLTPDGRTPFAVGSPGVEFPAVIAKRRPVRRIRAATRRDVPADDRADELARRVEKLEAEVLRLKLLLEGGESGEAVGITPRRGTLAAATAGIKHDDGEQCDCGAEE